jgi:hypothetical protein
MNHILPVTLVSNRSEAESRSWPAYTAVMLMDWMKMDIQLYPIHLHPPKIHFHSSNISWIST